MTKDHAIALLGGTRLAAAAAIGISVQAVGQWPDELPPKIEDRVIAALARKRPGFDALIDPADPQDAADSARMALDAED